MRKNIKIISLISTIIIFILLNVLMFAFDFFSQLNPFIGFMILIVIIGAGVAFLVILILKSRSKSKIKL